MYESESTIETLPQPDADALLHSGHLCEKIVDAMDASHGTIPFSRFMHMALYEPGLGYYVAGMRKFGAQGDFVTAPEISSLFGRCMARQCQQVLLELGADEADILEFGAGSGALAADILLELEALACLPRHYYIIELSPELQQRQRATLQQKTPHLLQRVCWLQSLPGSAFRGVILANEVLDAMPVRRFRVMDGVVHELHVGYQRTQGQVLFHWQAMPADGGMAEGVEQIQRELGQNLADGYESEYPQAQTAWLGTLADVLENGVIILVDYGMSRREYYHEQRGRGTLMCHYRHRAHGDALRYPGLQDITAYVDFTAIAVAGVDAGLQLAGYSSQAFFLLGCGLEQIMAQYDPQDQKRYLQISQQVKTLTLPGEMGERFKVMAFMRGMDIPLRGFALCDQRHTL